MNASVRTPPVVDVTFVADGDWFGLSGNTVIAHSARCQTRGGPGVLRVSALPRSADAGPGVRALALGGSPRLPPGMAR